MKNNNTIKYLILASTIMLSACSSKQKENTKNTTVSGVIPVKIQAVQYAQSTNAITATGLVSTENEAKYAFKIGGVIEKIFVSEGQTFAKGQLLGSLKITEIESQVAQAKLGVEKSERDFQRATNLYRDSVATLEQLQNSKTAL